MSAVYFFAHRAYLNDRYQAINFAQGSTLHALIVGKQCYIIEVVTKDISGGAPSLFGQHKCTTCPTCRNIVVDLQYGPYHVYDTEDKDPLDVYVSEIAGVRHYKLIRNIEFSGNISYVALSVIYGGYV